MVRLFLDTEFNEHEGELISLALVADDGNEWYGVLDCPNPKPWVAEHVMPILGQPPITREQFSESLGLFLRSFGAHVHVVADWPVDIAHFCNALITGPGTAVATPPITFEIDRALPDTANISIVAHNALEDARALSRWASDNDVY